MSRLMKPLLFLLWGVALILAVGGPLIATALGVTDPGAPVGRSFSLPSAHAPLGTDRLGRSVLAQLLSGNSILVLPPLLAALASTGLGMVVALLALSFRRLGAVLRIGTDAIMVIPGMILVLAAMSAAPGAVTPLLLTSVLVAIPLSARYLSAAAEPILASGFVESARVAQEPWWRIIVLDILPALRRPMVADLGVRYVGLVFLTATAAFLGASTGSGDLTWPAMAQAGLEGLRLNPWAAAAPCIAVTLLAAPPALIADMVLGGRR